MFAKFENESLANASRRSGWIEKSPLTGLVSMDRFERCCQHTYVVGWSFWAVLALVLGHATCADTIGWCLACVHQFCMEEQLQL